MAGSLKGKVAVITGASSGIGRAAALAFAREGADVVLAARRADRLREAAGECAGLGVRALAVPTDVTDPAAVESLAQRAVDEFGRIDVWVNNAGVTALGRFEDIPLAETRRVFETNLLGQVHGARVALRQFRRQGEGTLINTASMLSRVGAAQQTAYAASKFGVRGLGESLRQETLGTRIRVCSVMPAVIDTPLFQHAANFTGRAVKALNPVHDPEQVAKTMVRLATHPKDETFVGSPGRTMAPLRLVAPWLADRIMATQIELDNFAPQPAPNTAGNLFQPMRDEYRVDGGWKQRQPAPGKRAALVAAGAAAAAGFAWLRLRPELPAEVPFLRRRRTPLDRAAGLAMAGLGKLKHAW